MREVWVATRVVRPGCRSAPLAVFLNAEDAIARYPDLKWSKILGCCEEEPPIIWVGEGMMFGHLVKAQLDRLPVQGAPHD